MLRGSSKLLMTPNNTDAMIGLIWLVAMLIMASILVGTFLLV